MQNTDVFIPPNIAREELEKRFKEFMEEDEYISRQFWKHFGSRRAIHRIPLPSLYDMCNKGIFYDSENQFDLRIIIQFVFPKDRPLFIDVCKLVSERYINNQNKPASTLTLSQFKADLARRLAQLDF